MDGANSITVLLAAWRQGDEQAREQVFDRLYGRLHEIAAAILWKQGDGHTVAPTMLVHEAFLRFLGEGELGWNDRGHFLATAAQVMRRYLVDHIRRDQAAKRGGGAAIRVEWDEAVGGITTARPEDLLAMHEALDHLAAVDARAARVVEMKFFGGMTEEEIGGVLELSAVSVRRDWSFARAYLVDQMEISKKV